jgi:hypothetical protein
MRDRTRSSDRSWPWGLDDALVGNDKREPDVRSRPEHENAFGSTQHVELAVAVGAYHKGRS